MSVPEFVVISVGPDDSDEEDEESGCTRAAAAGTSWSSAGRAELSREVLNASTNGRMLMMLARQLGEAPGYAPGPLNEPFILGLFH